MLKFEININLYIFYVKLNLFMWEMKKKKIFLIRIGLELKLNDD